MRVNISIPDKLLAEIDRYCKSIHDTRSGFINDLIRGKLYSKKTENDIIAKAEE